MSRRSRAELAETAGLSAKLYRKRSAAGMRTSEIDNAAHANLFEEIAEALGANTDDEIRPAA